MQRRWSNLSRAMNDFLAVRGTTPTRAPNSGSAARAGRVCAQLSAPFPKSRRLADYCRAIEGFRKVRPQAAGRLKEHVEAIDALVWEKELAGLRPADCAGSVCQTIRPRDSAAAAQIDERLNEEKQKLSALDFDDLELRTLELLQRPEVITRAAERYKFFLVDEFQDTNGLQRKLLERLALQKAGATAQTFSSSAIANSRSMAFAAPTSTVFSEMTRDLAEAGGESKPLLLNFRSQPPLINFFNYLFERLFQPDEEVPSEECAELGLRRARTQRSQARAARRGPLVELMITTEASRDDDDPKAEQTRASWMRNNSPCGSIRWLTLRTRTSRLRSVSKIQRHRAAVSRDDHVQTYESVFRRANIPYQTVWVEGFMSATRSPI